MAVITGSASGIGFALAQGLVARGAQVVISDVRPQALEHAAAALRRQGAVVLAVNADVGDPAAVDALADAAFTRFGRVDLLCNNAGLVSPAAPSWEQELATWGRMMRVKVMGTIHGLRSFVPGMLKQSRGHILNTASSGGLTPLPQRGPYTATMHAVVGLTETLNAELRAAGSGFGATVLCPGLVDTDLGQNSAELGALQLPAGPAGSIRELGLPYLTARAVAESALEAVQAGLVHVAPGHGVTERAEARVRALMEDLTFAIGDTA
ncbi:SDR family NAD(P)-dependent oxidoreductase [Clavibacter michiganensis]|uniref:SDR family NAD(P)-dependent oxidoreductase n=1 Tax=Clavibacter michiganensis TaxID=28447 RepID=UPI001F2F20A9|nr:SDR family NAD(P)-dependent oxidoreductase [Clavibacter michiganensis]